MKFLINKAAEALIPFKEDHQGLLKLHVSLVGGVSIWGKSGSVSKRRNFLWSEKITYEEAFQNLLKCYLFLAGLLENSNAENGEATEKRGCTVKCGENPILDGWGVVVKILWDSSYMRVIWKLLNTFGWILVHAWLDFVTKLQKCTSSAYSRSTGKEWKKIWDPVLSIWIRN